VYLVVPDFNPTLVIAPSSADWLWIDLRIELLNGSMGIRVAASPKTAAALVTAEAIKASSLVIPSTKIFFLRANAVVV